MSCGLVRHDARERIGADTNLLCEQYCQDAMRELHGQWKLEKFSRFARLFSTENYLWIIVSGGFRDTPGLIFLGNHAPRSPYNAVCYPFLFQPLDPLMATAIGVSLLKFSRPWQLCHGIGRYMPEYNGGVL